MNQTPKLQKESTEFGGLQSGNMGDFLGRSYYSTTPFSHLNAQKEMNRIGFRRKSTTPISITRQPAIVCEGHTAGSTGGNFVPIPILRTNTATSEQAKTKNCHTVEQNSSCIEHYFYIELDKNRVEKEGSHPVEFIFFAGNHPILISQPIAKVNGDLRSIHRVGSINYVQISAKDYQKSANGKYKVSIDVGGTINDPDAQTAYFLVFNILSHHTHLHADGTVHSAADHSPILQQNLPYYQKLEKKTSTSDHKHVIIKSLPMCFD